MAGNGGGDRKGRRGLGNRHLSTANLPILRVKRIDPRAFHTLVRIIPNGGKGEHLVVADDQSASRAGAHPGTHEIGFDSAADTITLRHAARSREGFARGALKAAQWIHGKRGVHAFADVLFGQGG